MQLLARQALTFEFCAAVLNLNLANAFTLHCSSPLSCMSEYLAIDSGGYLHANYEYWCIYCFSITPNIQIYIAHLPCRTVMQFRYTSKCVYHRHSKSLTNTVSMLFQSTGNVYC